MQKPTKKENIMRKNQDPNEKISTSTMRISSMKTQSSLPSPKKENSSPNPTNSKSKPWRPKITSASTRSSAKK
jgi:hypothetical protein